MNSISCRKQTYPKEYVNPHPLLNYEVQEDGNGKRKFVPSDPVKPSLASDFNIINNATYRGFARSTYRLNIDPVDVSSKLSKLL